MYAFFASVSFFFCIKVLINSIHVMTSSSSTSSSSLLHDRTSGLVLSLYQEFTRHTKKIVLPFRLPSTNFFLVPLKNRRMYPLLLRMHKEQFCGCIRNEINSEHEKPQSRTQLLSPPPYHHHPLTVFHTLLHFFSGSVRQKLLQCDSVN